MRILVKGAGVAGLTAAYALAMRGAEIVVAERSAVGGGASWYAGGMLAPFCEAETAGPIVVTLGAASAAWWEAAIPGQVRFNGTLVVAPPRDAAELRRFAGRTQGHAQLSAKDIADLEPDLDGRFHAALHFEQEAHLDPRQALLALQERLSDLGVDFLFDSIDMPHEDRFDRIVDCTGMGAAALLPSLRGVRGEMLYLETTEIGLKRPVRLLHPRFPVYVVPQAANRFMVGATMIESGMEGPITARSLMELLNAAYAVHPAFGEARVVETASGVRPAYPDNLPRVTTQGKTLFVNGFYRHGFLLAPALAEEAADIILPRHSKETGSHDAHREWAIA